jgi:hypothetical protein
MAPRSLRGAPAALPEGWACMAPTGESVAAVAA